LPSKHPVFSWVGNVIRKGNVMNVYQHIFSQAWQDFKKKKRDIPING
jgi:hypothetical protein